MKDLLAWALEFGDKENAPSHHPQILGEGWVGEEALAIAAFHGLSAESKKLNLSEVLWNAAAHDGDSDSTAAIAGNLLVSPRYDTLAVKAMSRLDALTMLLEFADALVSLKN